MFRLAHRLFGCCSAMSLALGVAVCVLWMRSHDGGDRFAARVGGDRHTFISGAAGLAVRGPPPAAGDRAKREALDQSARALRNDQVTWIVGAIPMFIVEFRHPIPQAGTPADALRQACGSRDVERPLLAALDDPDRFTAAHVLLTHRQRVTGDRAYKWGYENDGGDLYPLGPWAYEGSGLPFEGQAPIRANYNGLWVELRMREREHHALPPLDDRDPPQPVPCDAGIDPVQLAALRDEWHDRLDVSRLSVPHRTAAVACAVMPLAWLATWASRRGRSRVRRRNGLCASCGYDLRASPRRCPECRTAAAAAARSTNSPN